jgi:hypothetical protein
MYDMKKIGGGKIITGLSQSMFQMLTLILNICYLHISKRCFSIILHQVEIHL